MALTDRRRVRPGREGDGVGERAAASCSRPIVDATWLDGERRCGNSCKTVTRKVCLAFSIGGSFRHLVGIKGNHSPVTINENPKAPIRAKREEVKVERPRGATRRGGRCGSSLHAGGFEDSAPAGPPDLVDSTQEWCLGSRMLKRIKYVSHMAAPLSVDELRALQETSTRHNMECGITGVLMTSGGLFFQVIEGPASAVDALWAKIANDPRHRDVLLISSEDKVRDRLFPDWAMETISIDRSRTERLEPLHAMLEAIIAGKGMIDRLTGSLERAIWAELVHNLARLRENQ